MIKQVNFNNSQKGLTIVEIVVTIVILGIALAAVAGMVGLGLSQSSNTLIETRAVALGYSYLDEIVGRRYDERTPKKGTPPCFGLVGGGRCTAEASFGPDPGETRSKFDDVDDFHNLQEGAGESGPLEDADGNTRSGYENFRVAVNVRYGGLEAVPQPPAVPPVLDTTDAKFITVTVEHTTLDLSWEFSTYRGNF